MTTEQRKIHWEKWVDPFGADTKDMEWPGAFGNFETDDNIRKHVRELRGYGEDYDEDEAIDEYIKKMQGNKPKMGILSTPMGMIPVTEHTNPSKIFNFWTMHTNFRITESIMEIIDNTDGVEALDIFTPYRWRIAIAKAFQTDEVKINLQRNLNANPVTKIFEADANAETNS